MLNHKFMALPDEKFYRMPSEEQFIRISYLLITRLKPFITQRQFREYNSDELVYGLSEISTILTEADILFLKESLLTHFSVCPETIKFVALADRCLSEGVPMLHLDGSPTTGGLQHDFILLEELPDELDYLDFKGKFLKIQDQFIIDYAFLFEQQEFHQDSRGNRSTGLNYHGVTILHPDDSQQLLTSFQMFLFQNTSERAQYFLGDDYFMLNQLLITSVIEKKWLIHFGI